MANSGDKKGYQRAGTFGSGTGTYSHEDFTYVRKKRGRLTEEVSGPEADGELNIVPYLDILVNLIMFLLVAQATLAHLGMIDVTAPTYGAGANPNPDPTTEQKRLRLTVGIGKDGFYIAARGGVLPGEEETTGELTKDNVAKLAPTIPKRPDGSYDFPSLVRKLRGVKTAFPDTTAVFIAAEPATAYEVIVKTLDATREDAQGPLFPNVAFTQIN